MHPMKRIRSHLGLTQAAFGDAIGCTQGNVGHYENKGQSVPPNVAKRLIAFAATRGLHLTYDDIYKEPELAAAGADAAQTATQNVAQGA